MNKFFVICCLLFFASISPLLAEWEPDVRLTYDDSASAIPFGNGWNVASTSEGYVHVVWHDRREFLNWEIYYKRSIDSGVTWGPDIRLTDAENTSGDECIACSDSIVHVVWIDYRLGAGAVCFYKRSTDRGVSWSPDTVLTSGGAYYPSLAVSDSVVYIVWADQGIYQYQICMLRSTDYGVTWDSVRQISNSPTFKQTPSVAASGPYVHVVWVFSRIIFYSGSTDYGVTWGDEIQLTDDFFLQENPCVAASDSNVHVVYWSNIPSRGWNIFYKRSTDLGISWDDHIKISNIGGDAHYPSIAVSNSNVHIAWRNDVPNQICYARSTNNGAIWDSTVALTNYVGTILLSISAAGSGVHVVWYDHRDGNWEIYYKRNPTGNIGVEETDDRYQISDYRLKVFPNPFISYTRILGYEQESFTLYDISGRVVGVYKGDGIGEGLCAGVYFVIPENKSLKPVRIVKVR